MRKLLFVVLLSVASVCFGSYRYYDEISYYIPYENREYHVFAKWWDGDGVFRGYRDGITYRDGYGGYGCYNDLDCFQRHRPGYYYWGYCGKLYPDYQNPRFVYYGDHWPYNHFVKRHAHHTRGFYRCYNREGLSVEGYRQTGPRG